MIHPRVSDGLRAGEDARGLVRAGRGENGPGREPRVGDGADGGVVEGREHDVRPVRAAPDRVRPRQDVLLVEPVGDAVVDDVRLAGERQPDVVLVGGRGAHVHVVPGHHQQGTGVPEPARVLQPLGLDLRARVKA